MCNNEIAVLNLGKKAKTMIKNRFKKWSSEYSLCHFTEGCVCGQNRCTFPSRPEQKTEKKKKSY